MRKNETVDIKTKSHPLNATYSIGKTVINEEGKSEIVRQDRQVCVDITTSEGSVFHRGARIA